MDNIIQFPKMLLTGEPQSPEDIAEKLDAYKQDYSDQLAEILWQNLLGELDRSGCDLNTDIEKHFPAMVLVLESIRSLHLLASGIEHPLQKFAIENISYEEWDPSQQTLLDFDPEE